MSPRSPPRQSSPLHLVRSSSHSRTVLAHRKLAKAQKEVEEAEEAEEAEKTERLSRQTKEFLGRLERLRTKVVQMEEIEQKHRDEAKKKKREEEGEDFNEETYHLALDTDNVSYNYVVFVSNQNDMFPILYRYVSYIKLVNDTEAIDKEISNSWDSDQPPSTIQLGSVDTATLEKIVIHLNKRKGKPSDITKIGEVKEFKNWYAKIIKE